MNSKSGRKSLSWSNGGYCIINGIEYIVIYKIIANYYEKPEFTKFVAAQVFCTTDD